MLRPVAPTIAVPLLLVGLAAAQQTIRVPQDQPTIEAAFAAAADGDRVLLTQASYTIGAAGLVLAKSLVIETVGVARAIITYPDNGPGTGSSTTPAFPALTITGFGSGAKIVLRNLTFEGGFSHWASSLTRRAVIDVQLATASGQLVLEGVEAIGELRHEDDSCPGLRLAAGPSVQVMLRHSRFEGAGGVSPYAGTGEVGDRGSRGAIADAAGPFVAERCRFVGGQGGHASWAGLGPYPAARDGGAALLLNAPLGVLKECDVVEGTGGVVMPNNAVNAPNPCTLYGQPGTSVLNAEVFDCVRTVVATQGCTQTLQYVPLNVGRNDVESIPPASVGVAFRFKVRSLPASAGLTFWLFGSGPDNVALPGIGGRLYLADPFVAGVVPPPPPFSWADVWIPAPPAALPWLPTFAVQPLHLDLAGQLQLGAVSTFTVLVP